MNKQSLRLSQNQNLKTYINEFNFPDPNWAGVPVDILKLSKKGLTKEEGHLLDGIRLAWITSEGRDFYFKQTVKRTLVGSLIVGIALTGGILLVRPENSFAKNVSAKTVTSAVGEIVDATMSAVFK